MAKVIKRLLPARTTAFQVACMRADIKTRVIAMLELSMGLGRGRK
jgi:hypothetical protein